MAGNVELSVAAKKTEELRLTEGIEEDTFRVLHQNCGGIRSILLEPFPGPVVVAVDEMAALPAQIMSERSTLVCPRHRVSGAIIRGKDVLRDRPDVTSVEGLRRVWLEGRY